MRKIILGLLLVLPVAFCGCELFAEDEVVEFTLPQWPDYMPELRGWEVAVQGYDESLRQAQEPRGQQISPSDRTITLRLDKNKPCSITATPVTDVPFFKPAGTIYPYSQAISWSGGYAAQIYNILSETQSFNWEKFLETLENCENPWLLDSQNVLEGIAYYNFTATKLKLSGAISVLLDFTVYSSYVPENQGIQQTNTVLVAKNQPAMFELQADPVSTEVFFLIISAPSAKNISLDLVSMPIFKEEL